MQSDASLTDRNSEGSESAGDVAKSMKPVDSSDRIESIDVLRGFALLGILILNIQSFGLPAANYMNPLAEGPLVGLDYAVWWFVHVFGDLKFMTLFSLLFGAGIVLMWERSKAAGKSFTWLHYRRMFWLALIGVLHAHLLWDGDILFLYGVCGMFVYWFCGFRVRWLVPIGILWFSVCSGLYLMSGLSMPYWGEQELTELMSMWQPSVEEVEYELQIMRGSWLTQLPYRSESAFAMETSILLIWGFWRAGGLMLLGMALFKLGFFSASKSNRFYLIGAVLGLAIGLGLILVGVSQNNANDWSVEYSFFLGSQFNYWGSVFVSFAYACLVLWICRRGLFLSGQKRLAAVGRMALTNYLLHTILCTTYFYGHGFGWFAYLSRTQILGIVLVIWVLQLILSPLWLERYRFGPFEWLWRSLSYWKLQPIRRRNAP